MHTCNISCASTTIFIHGIYKLHNFTVYIIIFCTSSRFVLLLHCWHITLNLLASDTCFSKNNGRVTTNLGNQYTLCMKYFNLSSYIDIGSSNHLKVLVDVSLSRTF